MKKQAIILFIIAVVLIFSGCSEKKKKKLYPPMGTGTGTDTGTGTGTGTDTSTGTGTGTGTGTAPPGSLVWAKRAGGAREDTGCDVSALSDGSAIVTGHFNGSATFGAGEGNETDLSSAGDEDIFIAKYNPDGTLNWAKSAGGTGRDWGTGISTLSDGSAVITGHFWDTATFGNASAGGNETVLSSAAAVYDLFIAKYNPDGTLNWAESAGGGNGHDFSGGITALPDGSTIIAGEFGNTATFGAGEGNETVLTPAAWVDIFIAKYNPDGTLNWAKSAGGTGLDYCYGVSAFSDGSAVVIGHYQVTATFGNASAGGNETDLTSTGNYDNFIAKYNPDGTLNWARSSGGVLFDEGLDISALPDGSAIATGYFCSSATFGAGDDNETNLSSAGGYDIFIAKYNPDGTLNWAKSAGGIEADRAYSISALPDGSAIVTGIFMETAIFGAGEPNETTLSRVGFYNMFIAKYNADSTLAWAKSAGSLTAVFGYGVSALPDGSAIVTGDFEFTATFGAGEANQTPLTTAGIYDIFIAKYNP